MDPKNLIHRKRSKKTITGTDDRHSNVIVVPPDILKKLGINIGNSNPVQQIANYVYPAPCPEIINNSSQVKSSTTNFIKKASESSIVETANLMKKSVFLSPTFVTTVTNVIPGEVEISENKHIIDNIEQDIERNTTLEKTDVLNNISDSIGISETCQRYNNNMLNCDFITADVATDPKNIKSHVDIEQTDKFDKQKQTNIIQDQCVHKLTLSLKADQFSLKANKNTVNEVFKQNSNEMEEATRALKVTPMENNFIIMPLKDNINLNTEAATGNVISADNTVQIELYDTVNGFASMEENKNIVQQSEILGNFIPLAGCTLQTQPAEIENNLISLEDNINIVVDSEIENSLISYGESVTPLNPSQNVNNFNSAEGDFSGMTLVEVENTIISLDGNVLNLKQTGSDILISTEISKSSNQVEDVSAIKENGFNDICNNVSFKETTGLLKPNMSLSSNTHNQGDLGNKYNIIATFIEDDADKNQVTNKKNILENSNNQQTLHGKDSLTSEAINMLNEIKVNSDIPMRDKSNVVVNGKLHSIQISDDQRNISMELATIDGDQSQCINERSRDRLPIVHANPIEIQSIKIGSKINIISEEIIPPTVSQENISQSSHLKKLLPVPLTTIIDTKKINKICVVTPSTGKQNPGVYSDLELLNSNTVMKNIYSGMDSQHVSKQEAPLVPDYNLSIPVGSTKSIDKNDSNLLLTVNNDLGNAISSHKNKSNSYKDKQNVIDSIDIINGCTVDSIETVDVDKQTEPNVNHKCIDAVTKQHLKNEEYENAMLARTHNHKTEFHKNLNVDSNDLLEKKKDNNTKFKRNNNMNDRVIESADKISCDNELNNILKSTKGNSNANINVDKVKEIAEYIKKFAHLYKGSKKVIKKDLNKETYNKKESINSKTITIKSKLCIQGVEKPGGNIYKIEQLDKSKILKTYAKRKKIEALDTSQSISLTNEYTICNIENASDTDLYTIDNSLSNKIQNFCLCYDFGQLDNCDNSYEHIHFRFRHSNTDLATVISMYNDNDTIYGDRTHLDSVSIPEKPIDETIVDKICWHYFTENPNNDYKFHVINDSNSDKTSETDIDFEQKGHITVLDKSNNNAKISSQFNQKNRKEEMSSKIIDSQGDAKETQKDCKSIEVNKATLQNNMHYRHNMNTIVKMQDDQPTNASVTTVASHSNNSEPKVLERHDEKICTTVSQVSCEKGGPFKSLQTIKNVQLSKDVDPSVGKEKNVNNRNNETESFNHEKIKSNAMDIDETAALSETGNTKSLKRSFSDRNSPKPTSSSVASSSKKNIKCGVCYNIFSEDKWEHHIERNHCYIAWRAGSTFNFDNPDLLKKLEQRSTEDKLECSNCNLQTEKADKFLIHVKKCFADQKGSLSAGNSSKSTNSCIESSSKKNIKCGVCDKIFSEEKWDYHIAKKHCYIAWPAGSTFNFDDPELLDKLQQRLKLVDMLKCSNCNMQTKKVNKFLRHVKKCFCEDTTSKRASSKEDTVVCGVCHQNVRYSMWVEHIGKEHNYLAWIDGQTCLNVDDEASVAKHLQNIAKTNGGLDCYKCGLNRKRAKIYLEHINTCHGTKLQYNSSISNILDSTCDQDDGNLSTSTDDKIVTCAVCKQKVPIIKWMSHIGKEHHYMAWPEGSPPLNINDEEAVWKHLQDFIRQSVDGLICYKCGLTRKRVKLYLAHIETCDGEGVNLDEDIGMVGQGTSDEKEFVCAVCNATVPISKWDEHIGKEHNYLAWRVGATPLNVNDEDTVKEHLLEIIRRGDALICYKCGLNRKRVKLYLSHIKTCDGSENHWNESTDSVNLQSDGVEKVEIVITPDLTNKIYTCAICDQDVSALMWIDHIGKEHQYLAWHREERPLDLADEDAVKNHLMTVTRENNGLTCNKCHATKKYPKAFQQHIKDCTGLLPSNEKLKNEADISYFDVGGVAVDVVTCGVCNNEVNKSEWMSHIENTHNYVAWFDGMPPLDVNDPIMVQKHLTDVSKVIGGLKCYKCGLVRKYAKSYQHHIDNCTEDVPNIYSVAGLNEPVECAVCSEKMDVKEWRKHAMSKHYNVAWIVGDEPIDINLPYVVEPYIKEYRRRHDNKLVCKSCGTSRVSAVGFYAHIITCGKTEEEADMYKNVCEICNNKYLCIYKSQHMTMHKEQVNANERRILVAKEKELKGEQEEPVVIVGGRRKAAEKAITVIEKYTASTNNGNHCSKCGFNSEVDSEMSNHICVAKKIEDSDSDASVDLDNNSDDDDDSDIDSNISEEEREARDQELTKSKKHSDSGNKIQRLPYQIKNLNSYMRKSADEFAELHLSGEDLFTEWHRCEYEITSESDLIKFMPPLEESCKIKYDHKADWYAYKRFEARNKKDIITIFTGACIQCVSWVPPAVENSKETQEFLSVVNHLAEDIPRQFWHDRPSTKPALIQIWDCGNMMTNVPEFVMGITLEYGTIWALDWCPSGVRDILHIGVDKSNENKRLGMFAAACANGCAYIFAVPYPSMIKEKGQLFYKLKPVVELRLWMGSNRKHYQATAIKWSKQKGHAHVVVGYADGTMAYYDLTNDSPMLKSTENGVTVIYPYFDERAQVMCIEDVDIFPTRESSRGPGPVVGGSVGGAGMCVGVGTARSSSVQAHTAAARVLFPPHWPAPILAGDDNLVSQAVNELEWYGVGRRLGGMRACCGCVWCGRLVHTSAPLVRLLRPHPAHTELHRQIIAVVQMIPFSSKRKRKNDELSMVMEPLTYSDAIGKYGIEFKQVTAKDKSTQHSLAGTPREPFPERFPLADVTSMMFFPSAKHHQKLAMSVHAGFVFIINI